MLKFSFDDPAELAGWTLAGVAQVTEIYGAYDGTNALLLYAARLSFGPVLAFSAASRIVVVRPGSPYTIIVPCAPYAGWGPGIRLVLTITDGGVDTVYTQLQPIGEDWQLWAAGTYTPTGSVITLKLSAPYPAQGYAGAVLVDSVMLTAPEMAAAIMAKFEAVQAAMNVFRSIAGPPYRTNLSSRVSSRFATPTEKPDIEKPWGSFLQVESPSIYDEPGNSGNRVFRLTGFFFFDDEADTDPMTSPAAKACHDFEDDVWEAFVANPTLDGTVERCSLITVDPIYGVMPDYAEVHVTLEIEQQLGA